MGADCEPGAVWVIQHYFYDCVYSTKDLVGFSLGLASIFLWITAQLPQFIDNVRNQSADALSIWFLAQWFLGDTLNLLGCLMSGNQLPTTTALAMYFVVADVIMLTQYVYYGALQRRKQVLERRLSERRSSLHHRHHSKRHASYAAPGMQHAQHSGHVQAHLMQRAGKATAPPGVINQLASAALQGQSTGCMDNAVSVPAHGLPPSLVLLPGAAPHPAPSSSSSLPAGIKVTLPELRPLGSGAGPQGPGIASAVATAAGAASLISLAALSINAARAASEGAAGAAQAEWQVQAGPLQLGSAPDVVQRHHGGQRKDVPWYQDVDTLLRVLGTAFGILSTVLYLGSRVSQIYKNWSRKSAEGLSVIMFMFTITANLCTGSAILLRLKDAAAFRAQLPWLCGAFGTVGLDVFIYHQVRLYSCKASEGGGPCTPSGAPTHHQPSQQHTAVLVEGQAHPVSPFMACKTAATPNPLLQPLMAS